METYGRQAAFYETAMVCLNGHTITDGIQTFPEKEAPYCPQCGAKTITACAKCGAAVRGHYSEGSAFRDYTPPAFCHNCGRPLPWTESAIHAWRELVGESEGLSNDEKERLKGSIDDLIADTPGTSVAIIRVKKWLAKAGNMIGPSVKQIVLDVGTEAVKRGMGI